VAEKLEAAEMWARFAQEMCGDAIDYGEAEHRLSAIELLIRESRLHARKAMVGLGFSDTSAELLSEEAQ
jgi:hypothetical protein